MQLEGMPAILGNLNYSDDNKIELHFTSESVILTTYVNAFLHIPQ